MLDCELKRMAKECISGWAVQTEQERDLLEKLILVAMVQVHRKCRASTIDEVAAKFTQSLSEIFKLKTVENPKIEIGMIVKFEDARTNAKHQGQVMDIKGPFAYVAVLGIHEMFRPLAESCTPVPRQSN